jgi:hypothetical protein
LGRHLNSWGLALNEDAGYPRNGTAGYVFLCVDVHRCCLLLLLLLLLSVLQSWQ